MIGEVFEALGEHLRRDEPVALATVLEVTGEGTGGETTTGPSGAGAGSPSPGPVPGASLLVRPEGSALGTLGDPGLDGAVSRDALGHVDAGSTSVRRYGIHGEARRQDVAVFIEAFTAPPQMLIFGAVDFAAALARVAKILGYRVTVCDARAVFATQKRFPMADEVVAEWPDRHLASVGAKLGARDAICVLTHDPKFDVPAIKAALRTSVGYIGAMGSRRTTAERDKRLRDEGVTDAEIERVLAPIGIDIGARTPEETAVSICAEIIALRAGGPMVASLSRTGGPIHQRPVGESDDPS